MKKEIHITDLITTENYRDNIKDIVERAMESVLDIGEDIQYRNTGLYGIEYYEDSNTVLVVNEAEIKYTRKKITEAEATV